MNFSVGQRYLSDNESDLGLGVVIEVDTRTVRMLFPQSQETRLYAMASAKLSRVVFGAGERITDQNGNTHTILRTEQIDGVMRYHISEHQSLMETHLAANTSLDKPLERLLAGQIEDNAHFELRKNANTLQDVLHKHPLRGLIGARIDIIAHQLYVAYEVGRRLRPRVLLADEVGLGKTIEAGLIVHHQLATHKISRVLILVPDSLQHQWLIELKRRFNLDFALFDLIRTAAIKEHNPEQNVFLTEQCIIASIDLLADHHDLLQQALEANFDMLVVDEAHHLHYDGAANDKYQLVQQLSKKIPALLLLTATPEQLGVQSHFARLALLDESRFDDLDAFIAEQSDYEFIAQIAKILLSNKPLSDKQINALAGILSVPKSQLYNINECPVTCENALLDLLDRHGTSRVLMRNTRDSIKGFLGRQVYPTPLMMPKAWQDDFDDKPLAYKLWPQEHDENWLEHDPKVTWLIALLKGELKHKKVLLIARSGSTVVSLEMVLRLHAGIKTAVFSEDMSLIERDQAAAFFADDSGAQILLCSEIGSEGRNFQFVHNLVLFDLPDNPDTLEQRIGRLDRIGQHQKINIYVPILAGSAQQRLYHFYDDGLGIFSAISPAASAVYAQFKDDLQDILCASSTPDTDEKLMQLVGEAAAVRQSISQQMQQGRDFLLEYSSCRPAVAKKLCTLMQSMDQSGALKNFLAQFLDLLNVDYSTQSDGTWIIHPPEAAGSFSQVLSHIDFDDNGHKICFDRSLALMREDLQYMTHEHPFMQAVYDAIIGTTYGNTAVALLQTSAMPQGFVVLEGYFKIEIIADKRLNLNAFLPQSMLRVVMAQTGDDLTALLDESAIMYRSAHISKKQAKPLIKARTEAITCAYQKAYAKVKTQAKTFIDTALCNYQVFCEKEIDRLLQLQKINPNVRDEEIAAWQDNLACGNKALQNFALSPDSLRLLVVAHGL